MRVFAVTCGATLIFGGLTLGSVRYLRSTSKKKNPTKSSYRSDFPVSKEDKVTNTSNLVNDAAKETNEWQWDSFDERPSILECSSCKNSASCSEHPAGLYGHTFPSGASCDSSTSLNCQHLPEEVSKEDEQEEMEEGRRKIQPEDTRHICSHQTIEYPENRRRIRTNKTETGSEANSIPQEQSKKYTIMDSMRVASATVGGRAKKYFSSTKCTIQRYFSLVKGSFYSVISYLPVRGIWRTTPGNEEHANINSSSEGASSSRGAAVQEEFSNPEIEEGSVEAPTDESNNCSERNEEETAEEKIGNAVESREEISESISVDGRKEGPSESASPDTEVEGQGVCSDDSPDTSTSSCKDEVAGPEGSNLCGATRKKLIILTDELSKGYFRIVSKFKGYFPKVAKREGFVMTPENKADLSERASVVDKEQQAENGVRRDLPPILTEKVVVVVYARCRCIGACRCEVRTVVFGEERDKVEVVLLFDNTKDRDMRLDA